MTFTVTMQMFFRRGSLLSTAIFVYAATAPINGYFGGSLYSQMGGTFTFVFKRSNL